MLLRKSVCLVLAGFMIASSASVMLSVSFPREALAAQEPEERQLFAMTTVMNLKAYGEDADAALYDAEEKIRSLDRMLSTGTSGSEVWTINHDGGGTLSDDAAALTSASLELYEETDGAFDFTIYPVMDLWGFTRLFDEDGETDDTETAEDGGQPGSESTASEDGSGTDTTSSDERLISHVPTAEEISALLPLVDSSKVIYAEETKTLTLPEGMQIDFGGIAKGYTSQKIMEIFEDHGLSGGLADLGGNIQVMGKKPDGNPWRVGIEDPADTSSLIGILSLNHDCTVITSGGYERYLVDTDGKHYPHIIDPSTGYPVENDLSSVSIVCSDGALADGLSTALCVMGKEKAIEFWKSHSDQFDMVLFDTDRNITISEGLKDSFMSDDLDVTVVGTD